MLANRVLGSIPEIAESFSLYTPLKSQKFAEIDGLTGVLRWNSGEQKHQNLTDLIRKKFHEHPTGKSCGV